jgi:hypothetical protein
MCHAGRVISVGLALALRRAGLRWRPGDGDRFVVPDRGMDDTVFTISEMVVEVIQVPGGQQLSFNGTVEWALDAVQEHEVVWLPREGQLRALLGPAFQRLELDGDTYRCVTREGVFVHADAEEAYGRALLALLRSLVL